MASDDADLAAAAAAAAAEVTISRRRTRSQERRREEETSRFPPPLTWLQEGKDGRRSHFMRAVKKDGRFLLTEVSIERSEIFRTLRKNGRIRLQLIRSGDGEEEEVKREAEGGIEGREDEERVERWEWQRGRSDGLRRCQEALSGNNAPPFWSNHRFATTA